MAYEPTPSLKSSVREYVGVVEAKRGEVDLTCPLEPPVELYEAIVLTPESDNPDVLNVLEDGA